MAREEQKDAIEQFVIRRATRRATPQLIGLYGPTFSGKTFGALLLASGLARPGAKIGFIDTENGRGSAFADDLDIQKAIPQGYDVIELNPPFHPKRYIHALQGLEKAGMDLVIVDSGSHAWEGEGGCLDIKEKDKGWNNAKLWNKRFSSALRYSPMDIVVCLRAQEKTKIVGFGRDQEYIPLGVLPICEKGFTFDLGVVFSIQGEVDGRPATHLATAMKWPKAMNSLFAGWKPQLLTADIGRRIREWNRSAGSEENPTARLQQRARVAAELGMHEYQSFFQSLPAASKKILTDSTHAENKQIADEADLAARKEQEETRRHEDLMANPLGVAQAREARVSDELTPEEHAALNTLAAIDQSKLTIRKQGAQEVV